MKKYIKPATILVLVANEQLLAGSPTAHDEVGENGWNAKNNFWEDED